MKLLTPATDMREEPQYNLLNVREDFFEVMTQVFNHLHGQHGQFLHALYTLQKAANMDIDPNQITEPALEALTQAGLVFQVQTLGQDNLQLILSPQGQDFFTNTYAPFKLDWYSRLLEDFPQSLTDPNVSDNLFAYFVRHVSQNIGKLHGQSYIPVSESIQAIASDIEKVLHEEDYADFDNPLEVN